MPARIDLSIQSTLVLVGLCLPVTCLYGSVNRLASSHAVRVVWQVCTAFIPFGLFVNHPASFQVIWPGFKPFGLVYKRDTSLCITESGPTSLKTG